MKEMPDGEYRFRSRWTQRGYWGITGALYLVLKAGGMLLLICLSLLGILGAIALLLAVSGPVLVLLVAAALIWAVGWCIGLATGIVRARRSRTQTHADDNVVPIEHAPRRRFHR